jgi:hypothetical protein
MQYSKLLLVLFLFIAFTSALPLPLFEDLFKKNKNKETENETEETKEAENTPTTTTSSPASDTTPASPIFDIQNIDEDTDIASIVTESVTQLIKNNLCSTMGNGATDLCDEISGNVIKSISGVLNSVIKTSINNVTGNSLSVACTIIPREMFKNLTGTLAKAITSSIAKSGNPDSENISNITNNVITIIINSVINLLCSGNTANNNGNVVISSLTDLVNNITEKTSFMNENVSSNLLNGSQLAAGVEKTIATGFNQIQNSIKMSYIPPNAYN